MIYEVHRTDPAIVIVAGGFKFTRLNGPEGKVMVHCVDTGHVATQIQDAFRLLIDALEQCDREKSEAEYDLHVSQCEVCS